MRILFLHQYYCPPGGKGNNRSRELSEYWVQQGHKVTLLTSTAYFPDPGLESSINGVEVRALKVRYSHMMRFPMRIFAFLRFYFLANRLTSSLGEFDLIYASSAPLTVGELGRKMAKKLKIPFVFETVDVWPDVPIGMGIIKNRILISVLNRYTNRIYREASHIVALSEGMKSQVLSHGVPNDKVSVSYNGTNPLEFQYFERKPAAKVRVLYSGTVGIANGVGQLVRAAKYLESRGRSELEIEIIGGGNDMDSVKALAKEINTGLIRFRDWVPKEEVPDLLRKADIGIVTFAPFPVLEANSANKFYDYLASGLPVVINYQGWQAQWLKDWNAGLSSEMGNIEAFAENILKLANQPDLRLEMGRNARQLAEAHFDRKKLGDSLLGLFNKIIS